MEFKSLVKALQPQEKVIIRDLTDCKELFRGHAGFLRGTELGESEEYQVVNIKTERVFFECEKGHRGKEIPPEEISHYRFYKLDMLLYIAITVIKK